MDKVTQKLDDINKTLEKILSVLSERPSLFIVCEGFNTPPLGAVKKVLNPETNTLPQQHTPLLAAGLLIRVLTTGGLIVGVLGIIQVVNDILEKLGVFI